MKPLETLVTQALLQLLPSEEIPEIQITSTKDSKFGDYATNIALILASKLQQPPRVLAQRIVDALPANALVNKAEIAGPGFINFFLAQDAQLNVIREILLAKDQFGRQDLGKNKAIQVEFVSANPTGPLHVGHGRGAAYGATLANLLEAMGYTVDREYYVNDAGRQMNILATSVWLRYLEAHNAQFKFPSNGYQGDYILAIAQKLLHEQGNQFVRDTEAVFENIAPDAVYDNQGALVSGDKEAHIDGLIERCQTLLGAQSFECIAQTALSEILNDIQQDLLEFGVDYQRWFSEKSLLENRRIHQVLEQLKKAGYLYEKGGAWWFKSTESGDDKDRVVLRENGLPTYFASDIAYHHDKLQRGYHKIINIWGADHHGYIARLQAAIKALGHAEDKLEVLLVQFANLYRGNVKLSMSTRAGSFVTLRELREEVGNDAARFFYVLRKCEQHMDFDLELAKSQSKENPVYYIQYAHARVCSVFEKLAAANLSFDQEAGLSYLTRLENASELALVKKLSDYEATLKKAATNYEPHLLAQYLRELAGDFHAYYNAHKVLVEDDSLRNARLALSLAVKQVIANGLAILGVSAPERM